MASLTKKEEDIDKLKSLLTQQFIVLCIPPRSTINAVADQR